MALMPPWLRKLAVECKFELFKLRLTLFFLLAIASSISPKGKRVTAY